MVAGKLSVPGRPTSLEISGASDLLCVQQVRDECSVVLSGILRGWCSFYLLFFSVPAFISLVCPVFFFSFPFV